MPVKVWHQDGIIAQHVFKYCWQRAAEKRVGEALKRPICLFADESQSFISSYDAEFLSTARASRVAVVYLTQSYKAYIDALRTPHADSTVDAILTNLKLKIFHLLNDEATKEYASKCVGTSVQYRYSGSHSEGYSDSDGQSDGSNRGHGRSTSYQGSHVNDSWNTSYGSQMGNSYNQSLSENQTAGYQETIEHELRPDAFARGLRTGGKANRQIVDGIVYRPGEPWHYNGRHWMKVQFSQR